MKSLMKAALAAGVFMAAAAPCAAQDAVKASPRVNKVLFENAHIRVVQSTFPPGASEPVHTHPASWYYVTRPGTLRVRYTDGKVEMWAPKAGEQAWLDGERPHRSRNVGHGVMQYILVEVKDAPTTLK